MITVNGKILEVGDTAVFRCGGKAVVEEINNNRLMFIGHKYYTVYCKNGEFFNINEESSIFDIIDIIKAPKPEIVEICYVPDYCNEKIKVIVDKTNQKILSVEIVP